MLSTLLLSLAPAAAAPVADLVAVQAGTIYTAENGRVIEGGGTLLLSGGKIVGVGKGIEIPSNARVVDYGPSAVIAPGFVAADSGFGGNSASERTAAPGLAAVDEFDTHGNYASTLAGGVTTAYVTPARSRLIAGHGAVVKLGGEPGSGRVLNGAASIDGSISSDARSTPGYWEPPIPATVDVGLGVEDPQLPRTTTGAIIALRELLALAGSSGESEIYGPYAAEELAELLEAGAPWRMRAEERNEIRALLDFFAENNLPLVLRGAGRGGDLAEEIAASGAPVIVYSQMVPNRSPRDHGKAEGDAWPDHALAAKLAEAGISVAIAPPMGSSPSDLRFHANLARAHGLSPAAALAAITSNAAEALGVADRVGSLSAGKDADFVVLNGHPVSTSSSILATWVDGESAWAVKEDGAVVLEVDQLFVGDGRILEPGQLLMDGGKIVEVGRRVSHPIGCTVVRGTAAMPGMIDAHGHLGLEGSSKGVKADFKLARIVEPGDEVDRRVARAGVTTVMMMPRGKNSRGTPVLAYKPAGENLERMVVADPAAIHLTWSDDDRLKSGKNVLSILEKAAEYKQEWAEYEKELAAWEPPAEEEASEEEEADEEDEDSDEDEDKDDDDKKKKKKKDEEEGPTPVTGIWLAQAAAEGGEPTRLRLQVLETDGDLEGYLRCDALSEKLVELQGARDEDSISLTGLGTRGPIELEAEFEDEKLSGSVSLGETELEFEAERTSKEYPVAKRSERRKTEEEEDEPKGKPKPPRKDEDIEPLKDVLEGERAVLVSVNRADEILACVAAFEEYGVKPILMGANDAWKVSDEIVGRVAGVLLDHRVIYSDSRMGTQRRNRYAELANAGIPIAFHSSAEEGAVDLPLIAAYAISQGMSPEGAIYALTSGAARMLEIEDRVGLLAAGRDADVVLLGASALESLAAVQQVWVNGREIRLHP